MNLFSFDLNLLKVLDALLAEGSTTRAGARVGLSQPAVSAALGRLRSALGDPLFVRQGQGLIATDFALALVTPLRELLERTETLLTAPIFDPATARQTFRLVGSDAFVELMMPALMSRLDRAAPGLSIRYSNEITAETLPRMQDGGADILFLPKIEFPDWLHWQRLFRSSFQLVARAGHPGFKKVATGARPSLDLFCKLRHVAFRVLDRGSVEDEFLGSIGRKRNVVLTVPTFAGVYHVAAESDLVGLLPQQVAAKVARAARLRCYQLPFDMPPIELCMIWHSRHTHSAAHTWLREQVAEVMSPLDERPAG
jgi:DNA-binding transcriptional LysR family regulator